MAIEDELETMKQQVLHLMEQVTLQAEVYATNIETMNQQRSLEQQELLTLIRDIVTSNKANHGRLISAIRQESSIRTNEILALNQKIAMILTKIGIVEIENGVFIEYALANEKVYRTANPAIEYDNGTIQLLLLATDGVLTIDLTEGQSMTLYIQSNGFGLDMSAINVSGNSEVVEGVINIATVFHVEGINYMVIGDYFNEIS